MSLLQQFRGRSLRAGSFKVMAGVAFFGASTYLFTVLTSRALGPDGFAEFSLFWGLTYGIGLGVSLPFEQETSRRVSALTAGGLGARPVFLAGLGAALVVAVPLVAILVPVSLLLARDGHAGWLWASCSLAVLALCVTYLTRGTLSGTHHFGSYATQFGAEGTVRLVAAFALWLFGTSSPWPYAFVIPAALLFGLGVTSRTVVHEVSLPPPTVEELPERTSLGAFLAYLGAMIVASTISMSLVNFGPVAVTVLTPEGASSDAGSFLAAALIARTPIFLFAAVQAVLIPRLVRAVVERDHRAFRATVRRVMGPTAGLGLLGVLGCLAVGPEALRLMSGPQFHLSRTDITLLAVSTAFILATLVFQPAAFALKRHWPAVLAWVLAGAAFVLCCLIPGDPVRVVGIALVVSSAVAAAGLAVAVNRGMHTD
jgi:O-antigen/teichoic acid export membrane protein